MNTDYLKIIFFKKMLHYCDDKALLESTFKELLELYTADKRVYHDITHIISLLKRWEESKLNINDDDVVYLAIWFHDAIFDTWRSDNEEKSAEMAAEFLAKTSFPPDRIDKVVKYIIATKTHESTDENDLNYFLDIDLSILGSEETIYDIYTKQISDEYSFYPSFLYNRGRRKVLNSFLEKEFIYKTEEYRSKLEEQARVNIARELESL
jgi:predicted metal-dependent HD superfamily phosphohydrolase